MSGLSLAAVTVSAVILLAVIRKDAPVYAVAAECAVIAMLVLFTVPELKTAVSEIYELAAGISGNTGVFGILLRSFALLTAGEICSDVCRDSSQSAVASVVSLCSKVSALLTALPLFSAVLETAMTFINR